MKEHHLQPQNMHYGQVFKAAAKVSESQDHSFCLEQVLRTMMAERLRLNDANRADLLRAVSSPFTGEEAISGATLPARMILLNQDFGGRILRNKGPPPRCVHQTSTVEQPNVPSNGDVSMSGNGEQEKKRGNGTEVPAAKMKEPKSKAKSGDVVGQSERSTEDATWQKCTSINWTKVATLNTVEGKLELPSVKAMLQELELEKCWCPSDVCNDDTCKAVRAAIDVATLLANSEYDPVFANYSVTSWGYYPSWVIGSVMGLDYSLPLPLLVNLKFPKGVIGYAVCDLLRVILTQSADQMSTGTCSYVASLAALTRASAARTGANPVGSVTLISRGHAPAKIIKVATRLFWTGMITPSLGLPCEGILHQQPGLVPFKTSTGYAPDFYSSAEGGQCFGNAGDCKMGAGRPQQKLGNQGGWYNSMVWECKNLLDIHEDSSCHLVMNPEELKKVCKAKINMLIIDATVLQIAFSNPEIIYQLRVQGLPAFGNYGLPAKSYGCNHAVYLESCDEEANKYRIWTWGTTVELTKEILLGYPTTQRFPDAPGSHVPAWNTGALCAAQDATWQKCTSINWTKVASLDTVDGKLQLPSVKAMLEELELDKCWCEDGAAPDAQCMDDTCKAVRAAIEVATELAGSEYSPVFANYSVTTWGYYPSWVIGSVHGLDYTQPMPVTVTLKFPKGVIGYAVCDLLRVILTQSADQMSTGTCSYVASLAALARHAPAKLIKVATRLFWTGMITPGLGQPCEGILHQQPGLVPFKTGNGWTPDFYGSAAGGQCFGNSADCAKGNQGGWYNSMVWECKNLLDIGEDSSCQLVMNPEDKIIKYRSEAFEKGILGYNAQQEYVVPKLLEEFAAPEHKILLDYVNFLLDFAYDKTRLISTNRGLPAFGNYGLPAKSYGCNHAVYLESCDEQANKYRIWTWGTTVELTKEILLGYPTTQRFPDAPGSHVPAWNTGALCAARQVEVQKPRTTVKTEDPMEPDSGPSGTQPVESPGSAVSRPISTVCQVSQPQQVLRQVKLLLTPVGKEPISPSALRKLLRSPEPWYQAVVKLTHSPQVLPGDATDLQLFAAALLLLKAGCSSMQNPASRVLPQMSGWQPLPLQSLEEVEVDEMPSHERSGIDKVDRAIRKCRSCMFSLVFLLLFPIFVGVLVMVAYFAFNQDDLALTTKTGSQSRSPVRVDRVEMGLGRTVDQL
eukprot:g20148.t2